MIDGVESERTLDLDRGMRRGNYEGMDWVTVGL